MSYHYPLLLLSLFLVSISSWPITISDKPTQTLALGGLANDDLVYATLSSPVPGQVLYPGRPFRVKYTNVDTSATTIQISLFNGTGLFIIQTDLDCRDQKTDTDVLLPSWVADGTYDFVVSENNGQGGTDYNDVVSLTVYAGQRPPSGIMGGESDDGSGGEPDDGTRDTEDDRLSKELLRRAPHPARFTQPQSSQKFTAGMNVPVEFHDGETTADKVKFILRSQSNDYPLGEFPFEAFKATATIKLPVDLPNGAYKIVAQENSSFKQNMFTEALSVEIQVVSNLRRRVNLTAREEPGVKDVNRRSQRRTELPSIILPEVAQVVTIGTSFDCEIHDQMATTENVQYVLRSRDGPEYYLGQVNFVEHVAAGQFQCPPDIPLDSYYLVAKQNSIMRPERFLDVVSSTVIVSGDSGTISLSIEEDLDDNELNACDVEGETFEQDPFDPVIFTDVSLHKPFSHQLIHVGSDFECEITDKCDRNTNVKFVVRDASNAISQLVGEASISNTVGSTSCHLPDNMEPGSYDLVVQMKLDGDYQEVGTTSISVANTRGVDDDQNERHRVRLRTRDTNVISISVNAVDSLSKRFEGKAISERNGPTLRAREPHPAKLITPVASQNLTPGVTFDCHYRDGETTATSLNFLLEDSSGNKTILGETSFSNFEARAAFQCPDLPAGKYTFVIEENSQTNPANFTQAFKIPVNLVDNPTGGSNNSTSTSISHPTAATPTVSPTSVTNPIIPSNSTQFVTSPTGQPQTRPFSSSTKLMVSWPLITFLPFALFL